MNDSLFSVKDQVALVSGASRGIGKAIAEAFARRGAKVVITGRNPDSLNTDRPLKNVLPYADGGFTSGGVVADFSGRFLTRLVISNVAAKVGL